MAFEIYKRADGAVLITTTKRAKKDDFQENYLDFFTDDFGNGFEPSDSVDDEAVIVRPSSQVELEVY